MAGDDLARAATARPEALPDGMARVETQLRHLVHGKGLALDPEGLWRDDATFAGRVAEGLAADPDPIEFFRFADATRRLDALLALADAAELLPIPTVKAAGRLLRMAAADMLENGTSLDLGLGIAPPSGKTARHGVLLEKRDALLRHARRAVPAWRDLSDGQAAAALILSFDRYAAGGWTADRCRDTAPAPEPTATWWRLLKLGLPQKKAMPRKTALADILRGEGGG